jgi:hypothetical protein
MTLLEQQIEGLIDQHGLNAVLSAIVLVCGEKAEHIATNWQENTVAAKWDEAANRLGSTMANLTIRGFA